MISKRNILDLKLRRDIYQFISNNPGIHVREISRRKNIPVSTLRHHLRRLKKLNLINVKTDGKNKRFYTCQMVGARDKELLGLLRQEIPFRIILHLVFSITCSKTDLAEELEVHPSTIHFHLKKLIDMGIIEQAPVKDGKIFPFPGYNKVVLRGPVGREVFYRRKNQQIIDDAARLLVTYKESMSDPGIIDVYFCYLEEIKKYLHNPKKILSFDSSVDRFLEDLFEIFPPPYSFL